MFETRSQFIKSAANSWERHADGLSARAKSRLLARDIAEESSDGRLLRSKLNAPDNRFIVPFQAPGLSLPQRKQFTRDMADVSGRINRDFRLGELSTPEGQKVTPRYLINPYRGIADSKLSGFGMDVNMHLPPKRKGDVPGVWTHTLRHELGHLKDYQTGYSSRNGVPNLDDRLKFHQIEKRAPGILTNALHEPTQLFKEVMAESYAQNLRSYDRKVPLTKEQRLAGVIAHLQNNYKAGGRYKGPVHNIVNRVRHGAPLFAQINLVEPFRNIPSAVRSLLSLRR